MLYSNNPQGQPFNRSGILRGLFITITPTTHFRENNTHFIKLNPFHQTDKKPTGTEERIFKDTIKEMKRNEVKYRYSVDVV